MDTNDSQLVVERSRAKASTLAVAERVLVNAGETVKSALEVHDRIKNGPKLKT
jgi:hypothetical protein